MVQAGTKRRGRPPKATQDRKRGYLAFRVTDRRRADLARLAAREGRSISEEIEHRLERTMVEDAAFGGSIHLKLIFESVSSALRMLEIATGQSAFGPEGNQWVHTQVRNAIEDWLDRTEPKLRGEPPSGISALPVPPAEVGNALIGMVDELTRGPSKRPSAFAHVARARELFVEILMLLGDHRPEWKIVQEGENK